MDPVKRQYEAYPYPARDPADEKKRLIVGSPSRPREIDHFIFKGRRDWSAPFRALVAGGGTGDAAIMLAQLLADAEVPAEILYLDMSVASRRVAEARAAARGLANIRFETGDLLTAPERGSFDYIDCCGVLHHLPDPQAGFDALAAALTDDGGLGGMVYAPHGRSGVYQLQAALKPLTDGQTPEAQVAVARAVLEALPPSHPFLRNPLLQDHRDSDAGLYDLLLHSRDRAYEANDLIDALTSAGLRLAGFAQPALYAPETYLGASLAAPAAGLPYAARATLAERISGSLRKHVFYAVPAARGDTLAIASDAEALPVLEGLEPSKLARSIAASGRLKITAEGTPLTLPVDRSAAPLIAAIDGRRRLGALASASGRDWLRYSAAFQRAAAPLVGVGLLRFSGFPPGRRG